MVCAEGSKNVRKTGKWSDEEKLYLAEITSGKHYREIQELMTAKFGYDYTTKQIGGAIKRYGLSTGFDGRFKKGDVPANKGTKGLTSANRTSFKKGQRPPNYRPIGSERINTDGYWEIKVSDIGKRWRMKHTVVYEHHHGKVPEGSVVIFLDGDKNNLNIENLHVVTRAQLAKLNQNNLIQKDAELTKTAINVVDVMMKINQLKKKDDIF